MLGARRTTIVVAMKGRTRASWLRVHQTMRGNGRWRIRNAVGLVLAFAVMLEPTLDMDRLRWRYLEGLRLFDRCKTVVDIDLLYREDESQLYIVAVLQLMVDWHVLNVIILSTQFTVAVLAMLWSVVQLRRGQFRMVVDVVGSC